MLFASFGKPLEKPGLSPEFHSKEGDENIDGTPCDAYNKSCCFYCRSTARQAALPPAARGDLIGKGANQPMKPENIDGTPCDAYNKSCCFYCRSTARQAALPPAARGDLIGKGANQPMKPLILQSDFGLADGAVSAMYGVAEGVCDSLRVYDLTHDIPQYDIWEASYGERHVWCGGRRV